MTNWDSLISASAWDRLVRDFQALSDEERADDFIVAEMARNAIHEVEDE